MNYVKEWMDKNNLKVDQEFKIKNYFPSDTVFTIEDDYFLVNLKKQEVDYKTLTLLLQDKVYEIEKLKPMELSERIAHQKYGYIISSLGKISKVEIDNEDWLAIHHGNVKLNESDAEREVFKRKLIYKLEQFAVVNNKEKIDWKDVTQIKYFLAYDAYIDVVSVSDNNVYRDGLFDVYFTTKEVADNATEKFKNDIVKYYTWGNE